MHFNIKILAQYGSLPFQNYKTFIGFYHKFSMEDRARKVEFYMHNLILTDVKLYDPNYRMVDVQLMALASWMTHEEARVEETKRAMSREIDETLLIRAELRAPHIVINNHRLIFEDPKLEPI